MENKDKPAFPGLTKEGYASGMTLYEYYLAHAPETIPEWFRHSMEEYGERPKPIEFPIDHFTDEGQDAIFQDYNFDDHEWYPFLDEPIDPEKMKEANRVIKAYNDLFADSIKKGEEWDLRNKTERYFQWRQFWAHTICGLC
jgi:hypothetical protein